MKPLSLNTEPRKSAQFQSVTLTTLAGLPTRFRVDPKFLTVTSPEMAATF